MKPGWRRAARLLARVAATLVALLLVASLAFRLWTRSRLDRAAADFRAAFAEEAMPSAAATAAGGGPWLRAAALLVRMDDAERKRIYPWIASEDPLASADLIWLADLLERERLPLELLARATRHERIPLYLQPPAWLDVEQAAAVPEIGTLHDLVKLTVAEELVRRASGDAAGACASLERLGRLARGLQQGTFLHEQIVASLPAATLLRRVQAALATGSPLPCVDRLQEVLARLDPIAARRRAVLEEGRLLLLPQRLRVLPTDVMGRGSDFLGLLFSDAGSALVRARLLDATRVVLTEPDPSPLPIEDPRRPASAEAAASMQETLRVQLRLATFDDALRRLALAALRLREVLDEDAAPDLGDLLEREPAVPLTSTQIDIRKVEPGLWSVELPGSDAVADHLYLGARQVELLHWRVRTPALVASERRAAEN